MQDLLSELNQETVESGIDLLLDGLAVVLSVCNSYVHELGVFWLLGGGEDEGGVGGGVLGLVFADGCCLLVLILFEGIVEIGLEESGAEMVGCLTCEITWRGILVSSLAAVDRANLPESLTTVCIAADG